MRKFIYTLLSLLTAVPAALPVRAAVTVSTAPTSLVLSPTVQAASSAPLPLFKFSLSADAGETLSAVKVRLDNSGTSAATGSHLAAMAVYRDNGNGTFNLGGDVLAGLQTAVNVGSTTTINTTANNGLPATFFVTLATAVSWSNTAPADSITASFPADGIVTSANSPTVTAVTTGSITADTTGPKLTAVNALNSGDTKDKTAGDSLQFIFGETTNKPLLTATQLASTFSLSSGHSLLDGSGSIGNEQWNAAGTALTVTLSNNVSLPTVEPGDTVTVQGSLITDASGNASSGSQFINGSFGRNDEIHGRCSNGLSNGSLYMVSGDAGGTLYLAAACRLKVFKNVIILQNLNGLTIAPRSKPAKNEHDRRMKFKNSFTVKSERGDKAHNGEKKRADD